MISSNVHLMPWRIIHEVSRSHSDAESEVFIVSLANTVNGCAPDGVSQISKNRQTLAADLQQFVTAHSVDVVIWPVAWREPEWRINLIASLPVARIAYIPGGVYSLSTCLYALRKLGPRKALPYLLDSLIRPQRLVRYLASAGFSDLITLSEYTAKTAANAGWPNDRVHSLLPGKDIPDISSDGAIPGDTANWLDGNDYLLFMGPPSRIRGIFELLTAFDIAAGRDPSIRLICLFRADDKLDADAIRAIIEASPHRKRIHAKWQSVGRPELQAYMRGAQAIVMPFILVPSEIPLAIIEAMAFEKPVISTSPGGTGEFVSQFGYAPKVGDTKSLADAMLMLAGNQSVRQDMARKAKDIHKQLKNWQDMADQWLSVARMSLTGRPDS